jgi:hypothetical protein
MSFPGPTPTCECGQCRTCYMRVVRRRYYSRHAAEVIVKTAQAKRSRRNRAPEPSDAGLDRRALVMMGRLQDA